MIDDGARRPVMFCFSGDVPAKLVLDVDTNDLLETLLCSEPELQSMSCIKSCGPAPHDPFDERRWLTAN
jgi:hypothetical protein